MWQIVLYYYFFMPPVFTPKNLFEGSRQLCSFLPTHRPLLSCSNHGTRSLCSRLIALASCSECHDAIALADRGLLCGRICEPAICLVCFCEYANFIALALASLQNVSHLLLRNFATCITIALAMCGSSSWFLSCCSGESKWGILIGRHFWCSCWKLVAALYERDWGG